MLEAERRKHYVLQKLSSETCRGASEMEMVWGMPDLDLNGNEETKKSHRFNIGT